MSRASDLHDELTAASVPVLTVRMSGPVAEVVYSEEATDEQRVTGEQIKDDFMELRGDEEDIL